MVSQAAERRLAELDGSVDVVSLEIGRSVLSFEPQIESRIIDPEFLEVRERSKHSKRWGHAYSDGGASLSVFEEVAPAKQLVESTKDGNGINRAAFSELNVPAAALDELKAEVRFQRTNLMADRRWREV